MNETKQNGAITMLKDMNWPTVILILLSGGVNLFQTNQDGRLTREEALRATTEVHDMHRNQDQILNRLDKITQWMQNYRNPNYHGGPPDQ